MDPHVERTPGLHLPQPTVGGADMPPGHYEEVAPRLEIAARPETRGMATAPLVSTAQAATIPAVLPQSPPVAAAPVMPTALAADDVEDDQLDKEWVSKAKRIVNQTREDPHAQSHEIGKAKADYLKIRYNKHVKIVQDKAS